MNIPYNQMSTDTQRRLLLLVLVLSGALRLYHLGYFSLWYDEGASVFLTRYVDADLRIFNPDYNTEAPLFPIVLSLWLGIVSKLSACSVLDWQHDFLLRLLPALFGTLTTLTIFRITDRFIGDSYTALLAALLHAVNPFQVYYAQELRVYSLLGLLSLCLLWTTIRFLAKPAISKGVLVSLTAALCFYAHFMGMWPVLAANAFALYYILTRDRTRFMPWCITMLGAGVLVLPALYIAWVMNNNMAAVVVQWFPPLTIKTLAISVKTFLASYVFLPKIYYTLLILGALCLGLGMYALRRTRDALVALLFFTFLPIIGNYILWKFHPFCFYQHRLLFPASIPFLILIAAGLRAVPHRLDIALTAALVVLFFVCDFAQYRGSLHPIVAHRIGVYQKVDYRSAARYIAENMDRGDFLAHNEPCSFYSFQKYLPIPQANVFTSEQNIRRFPEAWSSPIILRNHGLAPILHTEVVQKYARIWVVHSEGLTFDFDPSAEHILERLPKEGYEEKMSAQFEGVKVYLFERRTDPS
jgi:hypothetical protein